MRTVDGEGRMSSRYGLGWAVVDGGGLKGSGVWIEEGSCEGVLGCRWMWSTGLVDYKDSSWCGDLLMEKDKVYGPVGWKCCSAVY